MRIWSVIYEKSEVPNAFSLAARWKKLFYQTNKYSNVIFNHIIMRYVGIISVFGRTGSCWVNVRISDVEK